MDKIRCSWLWIFAGLASVLPLLACGSRPANPPQAYEGTKLSGLAPDFRLTDQHGNATSLSDFRGKIVALTFMDSRCDETCPLTALELQSAYHSLGDAAQEVVFIGVNVNPQFSTVQDAEAFTAKLRLNEIPTWRFLTGAQAQLSPVWEAYSVAVIPPDEPGEEDYDHTPGVFIIDQQGNKQWYVSTPMAEEGLAPQWTGPRLRELLVKHIQGLLK